MIFIYLLDNNDNSFPITHVYNTNLIPGCCLYKIMETI